MNKLFVSAAMIATLGLGAVAGTCSEKAIACPFAYRVKVMLRTTVPEKVQSGCSVACYRKKAIRRFVGFVYGQTGETAVEGTCGEKTACGCNGWNDCRLVIWDYDTHASVELIDAKIPVLDLTSSGETSEVEMSATVDGMKFSGFGYAGDRDGSKTVRSIQGYCAGTIPAGKCVNCNTCGDVIPATGWNLCGGVDQTTETSAYGKWVMQYDGEAASRFGRGYDLSTVGSDWEKGRTIRIAK